MRKKLSRDLGGVVIGAILILSLGACNMISKGIDNTGTWIVKKGNSKVVDGEVPLVRPYSREGNGMSAESNQSFSSVAGAAVIGYVADQFEKGVSKVAGNFSTTHTYHHADDNLYEVGGFKLIRLVDDTSGVRLNENSIGGGKMVASSFNLELYQGGPPSSPAYILRVKDAKIAAPKTAIAKWDSDVDVVIKVELSVLADKAGKMVKIVDSEFSLKSMKMNKAGIYELPLTGNYDPQFSTAWFRIPAGGSLPYLLKVTVNETADFYKIAEKGKGLVGENKEKIEAKLGSIIGLEGE